MKKEYTATELRHIKNRREKIRRERQLRRRITAAIAASIVILTAAFGLTSIISKAQDKTEEFQVKYYSSVMIPTGTSLSEMSEAYYNPDYYDSLDDYVSEVMYINHLSDSNIKAGNYIIMPYYGEL